MISGAILVQNNEATLRPVLDQLTAIADEVIVVDGGSEDSTPDIARSYANVRFFERAFDDDFSAQRNFALEQAQGSWIFTMDTDELLAPEFARGIPIWTRIPFVRHFKFPRYWLLEKEDGFYYCVSRIHYPDYQIRLFRNLPTLRYVDRVHETLPRKERGLGIKIRSAHIFHYCLNSSRQERAIKMGRYAQIGGQESRTNDAYIYERSDVRLVQLPVEPPGVLDIR